MEEYVIPLLIMLALVCMCEIVTVYGFHKRWIKEGETVQFIPEWKGTKKPFYWFLGWSIAKCVTDVIVIIAFVLVVPVDEVMWLILMPLIWCAAFFFSNDFLCDMRNHCHQSN